MALKTKRSAQGTSKRLEVGWIARLAEPYLRGYAPVAEKGAGLDGFWFVAPSNKSEHTALSNKGVCRGASPGQTPARLPRFFVGYLLHPETYRYLCAEPPECLVFVTLGEPGSPLHARLVQPPDSLLRKRDTYIGWLTHRPPRFAFFEDQPITLVRHRTMGDWPPGKYAHFSGNFFIETLAWLVRSGLVRKLTETTTDTLHR